jgi:Ubiquitin-2 like Rad60 SUMO-like
MTRQISGSRSPLKGKKKKNTNTIKIKVQIESRKKPMMLDIEKGQPMKLAFIKLSEELKCKPEQIRLRFDGEKVDLTSTPEDLEFEGGEILDCRIAD